MSEKEMKILQKEISEKEKIEKEQAFWKGLQIGFIKDHNTSLFDHLDKNWIFYDHSLLDDTLSPLINSKIPQGFFPFDRIKYNTALLYQFYPRYDDTQKNLNENEEKYNENKEFFKEKTWASEVAWRLNRQFETMTFSEQDSSKNRYKKVIDELMPKSHQNHKLIENKINTIANIALPSILESLICGVRDRGSARYDSTIRKGFFKNELSSRHSVLGFQGRMHPEISSFPRNEFYQKDHALQDLKQPKSMQELRDWGYDRYDKRSVWIDLDGKQDRGRNEEEAKILIKELESFVEYAQNHKHPLGEEWSVAVLSFYKGQTRLLEEKLQDFTGLRHKTTNFSKKWGNIDIHIKLCTVDRFQGQEADIVFLSMVNTNKIGFLDNPNRLNVGVTRAKFQLVILGKHSYYANSYNAMLKHFAQAQHVIS